MRAGGPYSVHLNSTISGSSVTFDLQSLYFGDVWLCSGQSNMEFPVGEVSPQSSASNDEKFREYNTFSKKKFHFIF